MSTIKLRSGRPPRPFSDADMDELYALWDAGASQTSLARHFHTRDIRIRRLLEASGRTVVFRTGARPGKDHTQWKGGRVRLSKGYIGILVEQSDPIGWAMRRRAGYVPEHRLVMAHSLGRTLSESETVHHINGDRADNRLENLQLRQGEHGSGVAFRCMACGSHNIEATAIGR